MSRESFPSGSQQQEQPQRPKEHKFYATEAGTVASDDNMESINARVNGMLADREKTMTGIKNDLPKAFERLAEKQRDLASMYEADTQFAAENSSDPSYQEQAEKRKKELDAATDAIEKLSALSQKMDSDHFSPEEAGFISEAIYGKDKFFTHLFLARLDQAPKGKQENDEDSQEEERRLSPDDLTQIVSGEQDALINSHDQAKTPEAQNRAAEKIQFYNEILGEVERFSLWQKDHPDANWDDYVSSEYQRRYKQVQETPEGLSKKSREKDLKLIQEIGRNFNLNSIAAAAQEKAIRDQKEFQLQKLRSEIQGKPNNGERKPQAEVVPLSPRDAKIRKIFDGYAEKAKELTPDETNSLIPALEGFKIAYPNESERLQRINTIFDSYNKKLQEQSRIYPTDGDVMTAYNRTMEYITSSVLTAAERNAFKAALENEKNRQIVGKGSEMKMLAIVPLESSLKGFFEEMKK
jgi:hypothetical protein